MARNICVDGLFLHPHHRSVGIGRYLFNLLREMQRIESPPDACKISVLVPPITAVNGTGLFQRPDFELIPCPAMGLRRLWRLGLFMPFVRQARADAIFLPSPVPIYRKTARLSVTVHDTIPLLFLDEYRSVYGRVLRYSYLSSLRNADLILTDSEYSKDDLISKSGVPPDRIVVTYLGFDADLFNRVPLGGSERQQVLARYGIEQPYLLHVGSLAPRKNLLRLIQAYRLFLGRQRDSALRLVLCGRTSAESQDILRTVRAPGHPGQVVVTGAVPDADLTVLYRAAAACAMPSLYEGFGLPLIEAMASGVPVMSSSASCLPEIAGDAALYFDPESIEEMSEIMERVLSCSALRDTLVARGLKRIERFSWAACARTTLGALKSL
jgi:glycosyltransferase involved in cell wall biosynthesis